MPTYMQVEPVGQCNLRCQMCPIQFRQDGPPHGPNAFMDFDVFKRLVDEMPSLKELHLQGLGEPMMHPRFFDMVTYAAAKGITVSTNTNMTLLSERRAELCITSGLDTIHISIDAASAALYENIRLLSSFERVIHNVERLLAARSRLGSERPGMRLVCVIMRRNLEELPDVVRLAAKLSIPAMFVQHLAHDFQESTLPAHYAPMRDFVNQETLLKMPEDEVERVFETARGAARETGVDLRLPGIRPVTHPAGTPGMKRCDWPWKGPYVSYQGLAMPCCMVATPDRANFGSMAGRGAAAVWNGEAYEEFRRQLASEDPPDICRSCSVYSGTF